MEDLILIRYGELNTKGKNQKMFIKKLERNIINKLSAYPRVKVEGRRDRMFVHFSDYDVYEILNELKEVFGIQSFSLAKKIETDYQTIEDTVMQIVDFDKYSTFKVITKRIYKQFDMISDEINRRIATRILKEKDLKVKMKEYDLGINIEIHKNFTYIFFEKIDGAHGYPVGVSGKGLLMLSGGIDSPVAGYLAMKRGIALEVVHFSSPPYTSAKALEKVMDLTKLLAAYTDKIVFHNVPFTNLQLQINEHCDDTYSMTLLRRMMYRISERLALKQNCDILLNGESIAQVASQTLPSMKVIETVVDLPIIRPVACFDKQEIITIAKKINTYETSILPYEDCCTIFLPKYPSTAPKLEVVEENEARFDYEKYLEECFENIETTIITSHKSINESEESLF